MFPPNLQNEEHRRAWEILQTVPEGQKNAFLVQVILENAQREELETILRRVLREELKAVPSPAHTTAGRSHSEGDDGLPWFPVERRITPT